MFEHQVPNGSVRVEVKKPRCFAIGERLLRDELGRELVVECLEIQNRRFWGSAGVNPKWR